MSVLVSFLLGGIYAELIRTKLITPGPSMVSANAYNQLFTIHGAVMIILISGIPAVMGNFVLPLMLGAKNVAFPRLNLVSYYCWLGGALFFVATLFSGGLDTGWTFYTPYGAITTGTRVSLALVGALILGFSSIFTGLNFVATMHALPAARHDLVPHAADALGPLRHGHHNPDPRHARPGHHADPADRGAALGHRGIFDPKLGGDPVLFQHFFWFYSHPAVYIMILPAMGIESEVISTFSQRHIFGYHFIAMSSVAIALVGFLVWGHRMFVSGRTWPARSSPR